MVIPIPMPPPPIPGQPTDWEQAGEIAKGFSKLFRDIFSGKKEATRQKSETKEQECPECKAKCEGSLTGLKLDPSKCAGVYQAYIAARYGMLDKQPFPIDQEWQVGGKSFDAFNDMLCILIDAKAQYAQFLAKNQRGNRFMQTIVAKQDVEKAQAQLEVVESLQPGTTLQWHVLEYDWSKHLRAVFFEGDEAPFKHYYFSVHYSSFSSPVCTRNYG